MLKAVVIDDENKARATLCDMIRNYCSDIEVVADCLNISSAIVAVKEHRPDIVFLDISMPEGNGFELLEHFRELTFEIVFVTAHDEYMLKAIRASAVDYLLKPVSISELREAISNVIKRVNSKHTFALARKIIESEQYRTPSHKIAIASANGQIFVNPDEIICLKAVGRYTEIYSTGSRPVLSSKNLREYEGMLNPLIFIRTHHSYIINLEHIQSYKRDEGNIILLSEGITAILSRRKKKEFLDRFQ